MKNKPLSKALLGSSLLLAACGGGHDDPRTGTAAPASRLNGTVQMGAVAGATVALLPVKADGTIGSGALATTTTDAQGNFSFDMPAQWPVVVTATGGSYADLASGDSTSLTAQTLRAVLPAAPEGTLVVSPYSSAVVLSALASGGLDTAHIAQARNLIGAFVGNVDPQGSVPDYGSGARSVAEAASTSASTAPTAGQLMAFALGAESAFRNLFGPTLSDSVSAIVDEAQAGTTLAACNAGAGDLSSDGTLGAPRSAACMMPVSAAQFATSVNNHGPITSANLATTDLTRAQVQTPSVASSAACSDALALLAANASPVFAARASEMQAVATADVTLANWRTFPGSTSAPNPTGFYGPHAANYARIEIPEACRATPLDFQRAWIVANETWWVDQHINYCHHHIPGWLPPDNSTYRYALLGNHTSGGDASKMTCTAARLIDGTQLAPSVTTPPSNDQIRWEGVDCSNFSAWAYNIGGITGNQMSGGIGTQACEPTQPGVLLDISAQNVFGDSSGVNAALADPKATLSLLRPGDLLYILSAKPMSGAAQRYSLNHVVTWTGKRLSELENGVDGDKYRLETAGQPGSRLGADFMNYYGSHTTMDEVRRLDPFLIIDSHYAGPSYRPFTGWYRTSLSHIRRIVGAEQAKRDARLSQLLITETGPRRNGQLILQAPASSYTLVTQAGKGGESCYQQR